uniref:Uncharacterized protein n=1 Tax=Utricularia reniformis TaxID=192314 RepID=A0A1Y0AZF1_9LAMI|nr:hypothetical protein AEK19_MT0286 [Utricularia reniformis]ART30562.1 hypothetical protein AEK19_MT0286 [Utricularia reniformis]
MLFFWYLSFHPGTCSTGILGFWVLLFSLHNTKHRTQLIELRQANQDHRFLPDGMRSVA